MRSRPVQDAKTRFSELMAACERDGAQIVTNRGVEAAVLVPFDEWRQVAAATAPGLKEPLLAEDGRSDDLAIPVRGDPFDPTA